MADLDRRFPLEPYRRRFGAIAERLRRTRLRLVDGRAADDPTVDGAYTGPGALLAELDELQAALVARPAWAAPPGATCRTSRGRSRRSGSMPWTSRSASTARSTRPTLAALGRGPEAAAGGRPSAATLPVGVSTGVTVGEVLATFRAIARHPGGVRRAPPATGT